MSRASAGIAAIIGTNEVILPLLEVVGGTVAHFCLAVCTKHQAGEHVGFSCFRPTVPLLPDLLHFSLHSLLIERDLN
jgi:hypothetical protein